MRNDLGVYTIAEVEERTSLSSALLRQWERRYGFPRPERSPGGHRLYSETDLEALRHIKQWIAEGVAPAQAVKRYLEGLTQEGPRPPEMFSLELEKALLRADTEAAAFGTLQQHDGHHRQNDEQMDDDEDGLHKKIRVICSLPRKVTRGDAAQYTASAAIPSPIWPSPIWLAQTPGFKSGRSTEARNPASAG